MAPQNEKRKGNDKCKYNNSKNEYKYPDKKYNVPICWPSGQESAESYYSTGYCFQAYFKNKECNKKFQQELARG